MAVNLSPFNTAENAARQDFAGKAATNVFDKGVTAASGRRSMADFDRGFNRSQGSFNAGFGQRGLSGGGISSGVMRQAMQQRVGDYTRNRGYMQQDRYDNAQRYDNQFAGYESELNFRLADIESQKAALIAQTAQHLTALKPYYGG